MGTANHLIVLHLRIIYRFCIGYIKHLATNYFGLVLQFIVVILHLILHTSVLHELIRIATYVNTEVNE